MIGATRGVSVHVYDQPCDMRKSFNTLSAVVEQQMKGDLLTGDLFLFVSRNQQRAKLLYFDGTGLCLYAKRLDKGRFSAPWKRKAGADRMVMTLSELSLFVEGGQVLERLSPQLLKQVDLRTQFPE